MSQSQNEEHNELDRFARQWHQWYVVEKLPLHCCKVKFDRLFKILQLHEGGRIYEATEEQWGECRRSWAARYQLRRNNPTLPKELALKELWYKNSSILETLRDTHALIQEHTVISARSAASEGRPSTPSDWNSTRPYTQRGIDQIQEVNPVLTESSGNPCSPTYRADTTSIPIEVDSRYQQSNVNNLESWHVDKSDVTVTPQTVSPRAYFTSRDLGSASTGEIPSTSSAFSTNDPSNMLDAIRSRRWRRTQGGYGGRSDANTVYRAPRMRQRPNQHGRSALLGTEAPKPSEALVRLTTSVFQHQEGSEPTASIDLPTNPSSTNRSIPFWPSLPPPQNSNATSLFDPNDLSSSLGDFSPEMTFQQDDLDVRNSYQAQHMFGPDDIHSQDHLWRV